LVLNINSSLKRSTTSSASRKKAGLKLGQETDAGTRRRHISPEEIYLVIEVSDTILKYDSEKKLLAYETARIPEYWIVDIPAQAVIVFRLNEGKKYQETAHRRVDRSTNVSRPIWTPFFKPSSQGYDGARPVLSRLKDEEGTRKKE
jgi:Putative restriction endonuclease